MKPFALLAVPVEHAILLDADVILLKSPQHLLDRSDYQTNHALFFKDRLLKDAHSNQVKQFISELLESVENVKEYPIFTESSSHLQESGVVVVNRRHR
jgi:hypothetical protein